MERLGFEMRGQDEPESPKRAIDLDTLTLSG
jgi:hypothetical protein